MDIAVVGAGAWGTAFSLHLSAAGHKVVLWAYEPELVRLLRETGENGYYLPGFRLPESVEFTDNLREAVHSSSDIVIATPSFALRPTLKTVSSSLAGKRILLLTKGIETETLLRMSQVVDDLAGTKASCAVLSGPSFAAEAAARQFTSVVIAASTESLACYFQKMSHSEQFRVYTSRDVAGVELGGSLKNVMAIGAGIIQGLGLGHNTLAAYITRALAEIKRLGKKLGAKETTFMGLSGMGDLILTCTGPLSRNRTFGIELAGGKNPREAIASRKTVVEGFYAIEAAYRLSKTLGVDMPVTEELYRIVYDGKDVRTSLEDIIKRDTKEEDA
jgi:glycerol-3-phosphate dehydrogenase (NAD(P)+)